MPGRARPHTVEYGQRHASSQRSSFLGFEMETELVWNNWDLEREFTKTLIIRNTKPCLQRLSFRPPLSKYFTSLSRQTIVLRPGTSFPIPVTFKPLSSHDYEDTLEFRDRSDIFHVLLRAPAPCHTVQVPESVLMPLCAVQHSTQTTFIFKNVSKLTTFFHWEYSPPFMLSPDKGHLKPGQELNISVVFQPQEALVHQQPVTCRFGTQADNLEGCSSVLLQGIAKHPYLEFKTHTHNKGRDHVPVLDFGGVAVGQTLHSHFEIYNPSPVPVCFTLSRLPGGIPLLGSVFGCDLTSAEVAPGATLKAKASFTPTTVNDTSVEYLSLLCRGAINTSLLKLTGSCIGPQVLLSSSVVEFGVVEPGQAVTHAVELVNSSLAEAVFQWDIDCSGHSVFSIQPAGGTVPPHSNTTLYVTYKPTQPILHYRRVACLILHTEPVFLNLVGNCHSERPVKQLLESSSIHETEEQDSGARRAVTPMSEYFLLCLGGKDVLSPPLPLLSVAPNEFVFNQKLFTLPQNLTSQKPMTVTSHSKVKLRLEWTLAPNLSFSVSPPFCELPPLKSTSFRVTYCPKQLNSWHGAQLECFAYPMDNDQCNGNLLPSCVTVRAIGHSYEPDKKRSVPLCSLGSRLVEFPPVNIASYRSVVLQNKGDLPLTFLLNPERDQKLAKAASLVVVPSCGLIPPHSHQILSLRSIPTEDSPIEGFCVQLDLNASKCTEKLKIISKYERPCVSLEGEGKLRFHPTALYSMTRRLHHIRNLSRQTLRFQWRIPEQKRGLISVEPDAGVLHPNESLVHRWTFTPLEEKRYTLKPSLKISPVQFPDYDDLHLPLEVTGVGCTGYIQAKEAVVEVKDILVGECRTISIPVINNSPCNVSFCVTVEQKLLDKGIVSNPDIDQCALQVHNERMTVTSTSTALIQSTITPHQKAQYIWTISYQTINASGSLSSAKLLCKVRAKGVYPTLQISDICGRGSLSQFSKKHLWRLLSLNHLNESLQCSPCQAELTYATPTRHSLYHTPSVFTKTVVDFSFSASPLHSEPSTVMLMLYNPGTIPVEWAFLFPEDQQVDLEFWAETGEFSSTELYQMKVQDNHLFSVTPRSGRLRAGQQRAVTFTYSHDIPGTDRFPVVLKISYGREIMLTFQGITVEVERPYLHFASNTHIFASVAIGNYNPSKQMYQLYNRGAVPVQYEVDKAVFSQIQEENFNHPVLRCLNPDGEIPPGDAAILEWVFSPLEAKLYQMDIPIYVLNGESTIVRFEGCGINSLTENLSNSNDCTDVPLLPCWQKAPFPEQPISLSEDSVDFGNIVVSSRSSRMLFFTNNSHDRVSFEWVLPKQNNQPQVLDIIPNKGSLSPGETAHLVLNLFATEYPTHYEFDIICKVTSETALSQYNHAVQKMEEEKERLKHEFTITDKPPKENKVVLTEKKAEAVALREQAYYIKYKTLPPIRGSNVGNTVQSLSTNLSRAEHRALRELAKVQKDPEPPKPWVLHLWVTAHSYGHLEFLTPSPDQLNCQYRPNQIYKTKTQNIYKEESSTAQEIKRDISFHVLNSLLRDILEDAAIVDDLLIQASIPDTYNPPETPSLHSSAKPVSSDQSKPQIADEESTHISVDGTMKVQPVRPELAQLTEEVLLGTLQNLMVEVIRGELDSTVHPRSVILPSSARNMTMTTSLTDTGTENMD